MMMGSCHPARFLARVLFPRRGSRPDCAGIVCPKIEGAGKARCSLHPQPRTQTKKRTSVVATGSPKQSGLPCAMVLTAYSALSSATNSSCHRRWRISGKVCTRLGRLASANLTPATGARTTRFCRPLQHLSSARFVVAHGKTALRNVTRETLPRPPHPTQRS